MTPISFSAHLLLCPYTGTHKHGHILKPVPPGKDALLEALRGHPAHGQLALLRSTTRQINDHNERSCRNSDNEDKELHVRLFSVRAE